MNNKNFAAFQKPMRTEASVEKKELPAALQQKLNQQKQQKKINITGEKVIGNGTFGVVFQATIAETGQKVAIKKVFQDKRYKNREIQIMKDLGQHPNVVHLIHHFYTHGQNQDEVYLNLIMQYVPETMYRVVKYYNKRKKQPFPNILVKIYSYQLLRSLAYIHGLGICHRDIKPTNVLIDPRNHELRLCDFGSAKKLVANESNISYICSRYYRAPELMLCSSEYDNSIDVWSTGCVIAEMILGVPIFPGNSSVDQLVEIVKILGTPTRQDIVEMNPEQADLKLPQVKGIKLQGVFQESYIEPSCIDLISKLLQYSPKKRISPMDALCHPYFDEIRNQKCRINGQVLPPLFNFQQEELQNKKHLLHKLVPSWYNSQRQ